MSTQPLPQGVSIPIPPPPPLDPPEEKTNTLALLLPHQTLFAPSVLSLLREHYESFGSIVHWAPVRGFGRVIVVYASEEDAERAKTQGDWLKLEIPSNPEQQSSSHDHSQNEPDAAVSRHITIPAPRTEGGASNKPEYFDQHRGHRRRKSRTLSKDLILRLHYLPPTPLNPDPASFHLAPPALPHNFLISPPGSPPEGWEPIVEDAPNTSILAEDLQRALEALQLNATGGRRGSKEIILDEGGVRVQVEDTTKLEEAEEEEGFDVEEKLDSGFPASAWTVPSQNYAGANGPAIQPGLGGLGGLGGGSPFGTPGFKMKPAPTARPPV